MKIFSVIIHFEDSSIEEYNISAKDDTAARFEATQVDKRSRSGSSKKINIDYCEIGLICETDNRT